MAHFWSTIVCLAKSRKTGGYCIAGKELLSGNRIGRWIRPISPRESQEISDFDCQFKDQTHPQVLDIIKIPLKAHSPTLFQCENFLVDEKYYWEKVGSADRNILEMMIDSPETLWQPHSSSYYGLYDRVLETNSSTLTNSLYLIIPENLRILVRSEGEEFGNVKRKIRAEFGYNSEKYILAVTDPLIENEYLRRNDGDYKIGSGKNMICMCVSIGLPWNNFCYKFVASVISI